MTAIDLIRERFHSDITPQERAWLITLLAALAADRKRDRENRI